MKHKSLAALLSPVLLVMALAACATAEPPHDTLQKGTLTRPPPAQQRPGVGLPIPGQPRQRPDIQPQPKPERYLPPTPGPGIWATNEPTTEPRLLTHVLPIDAPPDDDEAREIPRTCARLMQRAVDLWGREAMLTDNRMKRCLAAELFRLCVNHHSDKSHPRYDAAHKAMTDFYNRACVGLEHSEQLDNLFTGVEAKVRQAARELGR